MDMSVLATIAFTAIPAAVILFLYLQAARKK